MQSLTELSAVCSVSTQPYSDQKPGTSGLRKKVRVFQQPHYLENFVQSVFNVVSDRSLLVVGGDGRYFNAEATQIIVRMAAANGFKRLLVGQHGILSTPAVSHLIRKYGAVGGLVLSASHNPAGPDEDFGIKFNNASGSPAPESITQAIFEQTKAITQYSTLESPDIDLSLAASHQLGATEVQVIDSVSDYLELMQTLFNFDRLREGFSSGLLSLCFDAMHAVTGPYAKAVFEDSLGAKSGSVINAEPKDDFGGGHPDPNLVHAKTLINLMAKEGAPVLGAASDGDGDRNIILGNNFFVSPSDSLALIALHAALIPQFKSGLKGVARSMPTSTALDRVAKHLGLNCYETPTGWKFFGNLLDQNLLSLCGEESFGTSGDHVREKDGVWAVLCWLTLILETGKTPQVLVESMWEKFGRSYYCRHDFEGVEANRANELMAALEERLPSLPGQNFEGFKVVSADSFSYSDITDGSITPNQGYRIIMGCGSRAIFRLSGTGTDSAILRVYLEKVAIKGEFNLLETDSATALLLKVAMEIAEIEQYTGMNKATVVT